jgi:hypothetical protein
MQRMALAVLIGATLAQPAPAQSRQTPVCKDGNLPFAATQANRVAGAALQQAVTGRRLVYVREFSNRPGTWFRGTREHRDDGSHVFTCEAGRSAGGPWQPCSSFGSVEQKASGARDVGVWAIKADALCSTKSAFQGRVEDCFAIHRQGAVCAAKRVSGPLSACVQGTITFE